MADSFSIPAAAGDDESSPGSASAAPPAKQERLPAATKVAYAMGGTTDIFGHWLYNGLVDPVFNVFLGVSPTRVAIVRAVMLAVDALTGPLFGWLSDNTRTRWGRRRPWILVGSIASGVALPCLFLARATWSADQIFWFMLGSAVLFSPIIAAYNTPYQSLGAELTPDYNERTTVMAYRGFTQKAAGAALQFGVWFATRPMWNDPITGKPDIARGAMWWAAIAGVWMAVSGIANVLFVKERYYEKVQNQGKAGPGMFLDAVRCKPFLVLLGTALVYAIPTGLVGTLGFYALTYHVFGGDLAAASPTHAANGVAYMVGGFVGIIAAKRLAAAIGKQRTLFVTLVTGLVAFVSAWWCYTPAVPWLSNVATALNGLSATGLWVVLPSMQADVIDYDELQSGKRREGAYAATFSLFMKFGMVLSMVIGGPLLEMTGFDAKLPTQSADAILGIRGLFVGIPTISLLIALVLIRLYPLGTERMAQIRRDLEARRGTV
ncbi:MAG TPA: MFS transporter, partial [Polyangiaceae bacterium]|nr:MFS transporter [Polyangiaceae bacterium]